MNPLCEHETRVRRLVKGRERLKPERRDPKSSPRRGTCCWDGGDDPPHTCWRERAGSDQGDRPPNHCKCQMGGEDAEWTEEDPLLVTEPRTPRREIVGKTHTKGVAPPPRWDAVWTDRGRGCRRGVRHGLDQTRDLGRLCPEFTRTTDAGQVMPWPKGSPTPFPGNPLSTFLLQRGQCSPWMNLHRHILVTQSPQGTRGSLLGLHVLGVWTHIQSHVSTRTGSHSGFIALNILCAPLFISRPPPPTPGDHGCFTVSLVFSFTECPRVGFTQWVCFPDRLLSLSHTHVRVLCAF